MLKTWVRYALPEAKEMVRTVLATAPNPLIGRPHHDIYNMILEKYPDATTHTPKSLVHPQPPNHEHPIRSMRYLKKVVLEGMKDDGEVEKIHIRRGAPDENGVRMDSIRVKSLSKTEVANTVELARTDVWQWRLKPESSPTELEAAALSDFQGSGPPHECKGRVGSNDGAALRWDSRKPERDSTRDAEPSPPKTLLDVMRSRNPNRR